jgi:hypothetical protein
MKPTNCDHTLNVYAEEAYERGSVDMIVGCACGQWSTFVQHPVTIEHLAVIVARVRADMAAQAALEARVIALATGGQA